MPRLGIDLAAVFFILGVFPVTFTPRKLEFFPGNFLKRLLIVYSPCICLLHGLLNIPSGVWESRLHTRTRNLLDSDSSPSRLDSNWHVRASQVRWPLGQRFCIRTVATWACILYRVLLYCSYKRSFYRCKYNVNLCK